MQPSTHLCAKIDLDCIAYARNDNYPLIIMRVNSLDLNENFINLMAVSRSLDYTSLHPVYHWIIHKDYHRGCCKK